MKVLCWVFHKILGEILVVIFTPTPPLALQGRHGYWIEALESVMGDVIKIGLKRRITTRSGNGNQPLNNKTAVEWPILKLRL